MESRAYMRELEKRMYPVMQKFRERARAEFVLLQPDLKEEMESAARASDEYARMRLEVEQRRCIDEMLEKMTAAYESELTWTYMAGVIDCLSFLEKTKCIDLV